jgi:AraC-like DNA-binding protein
VEKRSIRSEIYKEKNHPRLTQKGLTEPDSTTGFAVEMTAVVTHLLSQGKADIERAAVLAGVSKRTLQRRLSETGVSYSDLVDQVRLQQALDLIVARSAKICDVARRLGYADAANFDRAFRRWTGVSPSSFRSMDQMARDKLLKDLKTE